MNLNVTRPCNDCPFRREGGIRLNRARLVNIDAMVAPPDGQGAPFACHKTTGAAGTKPAEESHCAGAIIYAENCGTAAQFVRILFRITRHRVEFTDRDAIVGSRAELLKLALPGPRGRS